MSPPAFALDTSCMVAAVCDWHEHHGAALAAIQDRLKRGERRAVPAHALVEAYAVLTRLPPPHRLAPADAWTLVYENFVRPATVVALSASEYVALLRRLRILDVGGGQAYDAIIAACARKAKVTALLTFNRSHFEAVAEGLSTVEPAAP